MLMTVLFLFHPSKNALQTSQWGIWLCQCPSRLLYFTALDLPDRPSVEFGPFLHSKWTRTWHVTLEGKLWRLCQGQSVISFLIIALRIVRYEVGNERVWEPNRCQEEAVSDRTGRWGTEKGKRGWKRKGKVANSRKVKVVSQTWVWWLSTVYR